jgi:hypothetical protein
VGGVFSCRELRNSRQTSPGWVGRSSERTFAWLHQRRRLLVRYECRADIHEAFLSLACCLICWRRLAQLG